MKKGRKEGKNSSRKAGKKGRGKKEKGNLAEKKKRVYSSKDCVQRTRNGIFIGRGKGSFKERGKRSGEQIVPPSRKKGRNRERGGRMSML